MNPHAQRPKLSASSRTNWLRWRAARGFDALGVSDVDLGADVAHFTRWLGAGFHGEMDYMWKHGSRRTRPEELVRARCACCRPA
jgi:epoxyqueuosine reductase